MKETAAQGERSGDLIKLAVWLAAVACSCAPTLLAPSVIAHEPLDPTKPSGRIGLRSGPRPSAAIAGLDAGSFQGANDSFHVPEWSVAYDFAASVPMKNTGVRLHFGIQAEFFFPIPLPAVGAMFGGSYQLSFGRFRLIPALSFRGNTDFFIKGVFGSSGSLLTGDFSPTLSFRPDAETSVGLTPFVSVTGLWTPDGAGPQRLVYVGGVVSASFKKVELLTGFGRVFLPDGRSWNVPIIGIRGGEN